MMHGRKGLTPHKAKATDKLGPIDARSRIVKSRPSNLRALQHDDLITNKLDAQLKIYSNILVNAHCERVDAAESTAESALQDMFTQFSVSCSILEEAEKHLQVKLSDEAINIDNEVDLTSPQRVSLEQRMREYRDEVRTRTKDLEALWKEWSDVERDILSLAVEVLGKDFVDQDDELSDGLRKVIAQAREVHQQACSAEDIALEELLNLQADAEQLNNRSIRENRQYLEDIRIGRRNQFREVGRLIKAFGSC